MERLFSFVGDTMSIKPCVYKCSCQNVINQAANTCNVDIVKSVCGTILQLAIIVAIAILLYYIAKRLFDLKKQKMDRIALYRKDALDYIKSQVKEGKQVEGDAYVAKIEQYTKYCCKCKKREK